MVSSASRLSKILIFSRVWLDRVVLILLLSVLSSCAPATPARELTSLNVQLRWTHQAQFAGFYAANQNGDYAAEGLEVTFLEGGPDVDIHAPLAEGVAQFGVAGADTLILKRAEGIPIKAVATIYRRNPLVFVALAESGITRPQEFSGKTILVASFNRPILHAMSSRVGVPPDRYIETCCSFDDFLSGRIQVAHAYLTNEVITAPMQGHEITIISPDDYGVHFYADTLYTTDEFIAEHPDIVQRFLRASLKGWMYMIEKPEAAGPLVQRYHPAADPDLEVAKMIASIPLVNTGQDYIGWMEPGVWSGMEETLRSLGVLKSSLDVEQVYTLQFLEEIYLR